MLLNVLSNYIPPRERIITIEDAAELRLRPENVVTLETREGKISDRNRITMRDLIRTSLWARLDRIIVGEIRGPEAVDMLTAMNTGHLVFSDLLGKPNSQTILHDCAVSSIAKAGRKLWIMHRTIVFPMVCSQKNRWSCWK